MYMFENGDYKKVTKSDTEGNLLLAVILAGIVMIPLYVLWKIISTSFILIVAFIMGGNNKKNKK